MAATEVAEVEATVAIITDLAMMDMAEETEVMVTARHRLLAASKTYHLDLPHKLQHTLAGTVVVVVCPHLLRQAGCLVWLLLLLNIIKVVMAEVIITTVVVTIMEVMEEAATTAAAEITMAEDIAVEEEEAEVVVEEVVMTDIRRNLLVLALRSGERISSQKA